MTAVPHDALSSSTIRRNTLVGASAILLWATLALLTAIAGPVPPFQMTAMAFGVGGLMGLLVMLATGRRPLAALRQPPRVWLLGVSGLFGYHFLYFLALQSAPAVEANLVNYLWPLMIVLFAGLLPGERLGLPQLLGALLGLAGTVLLVTRGQGLSLDLQYLPGYLAALGCAVTWGAYSVLTRRYGEAPTESVAFFCLATSGLAALCHLTFETTVWPQGAAAWAATAAMGIGPLGAAFFVWDVGVKRGDIHALGAISYVTPLLSTLLLILAGRAEGAWSVWAACALIIGGAVVAAKGLGKR
ncbi:MAG TPA: DMT family transporter [Azospirillaceae bacterium]|nr:DMT family transporter [Azospirillaceae bacterium]